MNSRPVTMEIEHAGHPPTVRTGLSIDDVGNVIRGLEGEPDVTATVSPDEGSEYVLVGVSGVNVFLGLVRPLDELYHYVARGNEDRRGNILFMTSGEPTNIPSQHVVDITTAIAVVQEWLTSGYESSSLGRWEHT
jgi:Immunity protein Imm1